MRGALPGNAGASLESGFDRAASVWDGFVGSPGDDEIELFGAGGDEKAETAG